MKRKMLVFVALLVVVSSMVVGMSLAQDAGDPARGQAIWEEGSCKRCHGEAGEGSYAKPLAGNTKPIGDWIQQVRTPKKRMPAYNEAKIDDQTIADLHAYMGTLTEPTSFSPISYVADPDDSAGKVLFNEKRCVACHGNTTAFIQRNFVEKDREVSTEGVIKQLRTPFKWMPVFSASQVTDEHAAQIAEYLASVAGPAPVVDPSWAPTELLEGKVGIVVRTMVDDPFQVALAEAAELKAKAVGLEPLVRAASSHTDVEEQQAIFEDLIDQAVDGILLAPLDAQALKVSMEEADAAGIPVVMFDSNPIEGAPFVTAIGTDNTAAAAIAAEFLIEKFDGTAKVAQIEGEPGAQNALLRASGFQDRLRAEEGMEVVASQTGHWTTEGAMQAMESILSANLDIDAVFASSDMMGLGVVEALQETGMLGDVTVLTFDGIPDGIDLIKQGATDGDVAQHPTKMGEMGIVVIGQLLADEKAAADFPQYIDSGAELVTPETADAFLLETFGIEASE